MITEGKTIERLPEEVKKNGFLYRLVERESGKCLYEQTSFGMPVGYEVFLTKYSDARAAREYWAKHNGSEVVHENKPDLKEIFPKNEEFGVRAWTFPTLVSAKIAYDKLLISGETI